MPFWYTPKCKMLVLFLIAIAVTSLIYYPILAIAKKKNIVDNPDARKLQKEPVPVLGGLAVFFGIVFALCYFKTTISHTSLFPVLGVMVIMLYLGSIDDILQLGSKLRFVLEIVAGILMIYGTRFAIMNFQGVFGIVQLSPVLAVPLSIIAFVGVINAINMIDGIDGLLSSFGIYACTCFGLFCFLLHDYSYAALAAVTGGALIPFLLHNVFGKRTKMFMGDGGSLMIGTVLMALIFSLLRMGSLDPLEKYLSPDLSILSFCLAVMAVPVFDTLRVMTKRIVAHESPFHADKTHLHHLFLELGFPHRSVVFRELILSVLVLIVWLVLFLIGLSSTWQFVGVVISGLSVTLGFSLLLNHSSRFRTFMINSAARCSSRVKENGLLNRLADKEF